MKKILLPTDFSDNAWNAITFALQLFKDEACTFYLLNSFSQPMSTPTAGITSTKIKESIYKAQLEASKEGLAEVLNKIKSEFKNEQHKFVTLSVYDSFPAAIKKVVEDKEIQSIIMGTKGATALKEMTIGSNTSGLIGVAQCPILAIPQNAKFKEIEEIGFSTDFEIDFNEKGLDKLLYIIKKTEAKVSVVNIMEKARPLTEIQERGKAQLQDLFRDTETNFYTLTDIGVSSGVHAFVESRNLDLLCVVAKEQDFLKRFLGMSYSKSISNHSSIPLLVLNIKQF
ncbi:universal stress protein [Formosa sp. S-31]|uniref:universal stress protein n=1 Tax=Formosa sp. S-31 TaxID=2790949 RepID=UPI003EB7DAE6